ncbi:MAG: polyphosphate polymerase domain-containing protein [Limisphaerales bacterium]
MTLLPSNPRYERKFVADGLALSDVLALVRRHPAGFRETYPARSVNNLYLDSPEFRDYHDHVNGVAHRTKTRLRWYGAWAGRIDIPTLESKTKLGHVSGKVSHGLPPLSMNGHVSRPDLEAAFDGANLPALTRAALHHLEPSLLNRYRRHYFQSADGRFRLTADSDLQFAAARQAQGMGVSFRPPAATVVVELKYGLAEAEYAAPVTNALPFRLARCSKYVLGINTLAAR